MKTLDFNQVKDVDIKNYIYSINKDLKKSTTIFDITHDGDMIRLDMQVLYPYNGFITFKDALSVSFGGNPVGMAICVVYNKFSLIRQITIL